MGNYKKGRVHLQICREGEGYPRTWWGKREGEGGVAGAVIQRKGTAQGCFREKRRGDELPEKGKVRQAIKLRGTGGELMPKKTV